MAHICPFFMANQPADSIPTSPCSAFTAGLSKEPLLTPKYKAAISFPDQIMPLKSRSSASYKTPEAEFKTTQASHTHWSFCPNSPVNKSLLKLIESLLFSENTVCKNNAFT